MLIKLTQLIRNLYNVKQVVVLNVFLVCNEY